MRSSFGFHVIKVTDHKDAETVTLETAKPKLLAYLKQQKRQAEMQSVIKAIREKADVKINLPDAPVAPAPAVDPAPAAPAAPK